MAVRLCPRAHMNNPITKRNVVILPDAFGSQQAIACSRQVAKKYKTTFVLDEKYFYPHITLYQAAYPNKNLLEVDRQLSSIVEDVTPFQVRGKTFTNLFGF